MSLGMGCRAGEIAMKGVHKDNRYYHDAASAAQTLRWLEQSGPRYSEMHCTFNGLNLTKDGDWLAVLFVSGADEPEDVRQDQMSFASWGICIAAECGQVITLKIRTDPVALASLPT